MATKITLEVQEQINTLYLKYKTYAAVAREVGIAPTTVKKYIIKDFVPREGKEEVEFNDKLFDEDFVPFDFSENALMLTEKEKEKMMEIIGKVAIW